MERCSIFDNVTLNTTTGSMEPWQEAQEDQKNWDLRFEIKILALFLYLFLFTFVEFLFNKQISVDKEQTEQTAAQNDNHETVDDSVKAIEPGLEENERNLREETKERTVDSPSVKATPTPVKRKMNNASQRKKEAPKRHLIATDLTNIEPVAKKKYQELQIIIDFHDIRELKQHPEMSLPGADIRKWPSISEIKQQQHKIQPLKNKNIPKEECESLCSYIHYTDHILLQRVYNYLQELLQLVGDGCKIIETEHQIIVKVLMVKDAIGLWEKKQLNHGTKETGNSKTLQKDQALSLVKSGKKQVKPTKMVQKEMNSVGQVKQTDKQNLFGPLKDFKRKELGKQFKEGKRKVLAKSKTPAAEVQEKDVPVDMTEAENQSKYNNCKKENLGKEKSRSGKEECRSGNEESKSKKDVMKSKKDSSSKSKKESTKSKKDSAKDIASLQNESCKQNKATCHEAEGVREENDNGKNIVGDVAAGQNANVQANDHKMKYQEKIINGQDMSYSCNSAENIKDATENLCKTTEEYNLYFGKDLKEQTMSCCCEDLSGNDCVYKIAAKEAIACFCNNLEQTWVTCPCKDSNSQDIVCDCKITENGDKICLCTNTENNVVCMCENLKDSLIVCPCQSSGGEGTTCACKTAKGQCNTCRCKNADQKCMACSCQAEEECVACLAENTEEFTICSNKGLKEESLGCPFKNSREEGITCLCENTQEQNMACSCRNLTTELASHCGKRNECVECLCKITKQQDMVCTYYNHGLQNRPCPCCKSEEQNLVCSYEATNI